MQELKSDSDEIMMDIPLRGWKGLSYRERKQVRRIIRRIKVRSKRERGKRKRSK